MQGSLVDDTDGKIPRYRVTGVWNKPDSHTLEITELPIGVWTQHYKKFLETLLEAGKKRTFAVVKVRLLAYLPLMRFAVHSHLMQYMCAQEYTEHHTDSKVHFVITLTDEAAAWDNDEIEKQLKLSKYISMNNIHLHDRNGHIARYGSCLSVLQEFYDLRLEYYEKRKVTPSFLSLLVCVSSPSVPVTD
jgi:DNA topoisomerase-2